MFTAQKRLAFGAAIAASAVLVLAGCSSSNPLEEESAGGGEPAGDTIVIGSQDYYSNEIIAEIYAQALEEAGYDIQRDFRIGQREVYLPEIEEGSIDLFPEYTGPLLLVWEPDTSARTTDEIYEALVEAAPDGLRVLDQSDASDQDSYVVTRAFAEEYGVQTIADLADVPVPITLGGNSEGETRPIGPAGLAAEYGVEVDFTPIEDGGGPLTVKALLEDQVQLAVIYTASPSMADPELVALEDPDGFMLASHVVPLASDKLDDDAAEIINRVSAAMTAEGLVALNTESVETQASAASIASAWLEEHQDVLG
jgi:osmoprotectant transport system substrate-binding protein